MTANARPRVLMLSAVHPGHASRSGPVRLADFVPGAELITAPRRDAEAGLPLLAARIARRFSFTRWYLGGSLELEWKASRRLRAGFQGVVHSLWADHDLGYLDLFLQRGQKLCGTFHNCDDTFPHTIRFPSRLRQFSAIVLVSETQRAFFLGHGVDPASIHVVLYGVDTAFFRPPAEPPEQFSVLSVGGFRRNFETLREVCAGLPDIRFCLVAPPAFREKFAGLDKVQFLSGITDDELLSLYQSASCLLHTAENATANNALVEAMACGTPIVAERVGGIPEYATSDAALLCAPRDAAGLIESIKRLRDSPALRAELSAGALARGETLSWPRVAGRMQEIYASL